MTDGRGGGGVPPVQRRALVLGLGRPQELRLLAACREDPRVRITARCSSADEVLAAIQARSADVILVDEDLHLLDDEHLGYLGAADTPTVVLSREPKSERWQTNRNLVVLPAETDAGEILTALAEVGRHQRGHGPRAKTQLVDPQPAAVPDVAPPGYLQVLAFWSGPGSPGRTTMAINWGTLLGWVARTVIVDLNLTGAAVTAQLDQTQPDIARRGFVGSSILQLASASPASPDNWLHEVFRVGRPMGPLSPHTDLLAGVLQPWLRNGISADFVERLIAELRGHYQYVLLDLGDEPLGEATREAAVSSAALRAADQILVVCPPDAAGLHQTYMALAQAGPLVDRERAGLVVNRYEPRYHQPNVAAIEDALKLPLVGVLPFDHDAVQRALIAGQPVVCDRRSKLRRPLQDLAEQVHGGHIENENGRAKRVRLASPGRAVRSAAAGLIGSVGAVLSGFAAAGGR